MKILMWAVMLVSLVVTLPLSWLGLAHYYTGQGLHPVLASVGIAVSLALGWAAARNAG